mmetsp:Transcript_585/g.1156  ORF Transcript_585/g.1156 Transcript_585/m.1156 type:complete len:128 (+) Transcript_585:62-445(+)
MGPTLFQAASHKDFQFTEAQRENGSWVGKRFRGGLMDELHQVLADALNLCITERPRNSFKQSKRAATFRVVCRANQRVKSHAFLHLPRHLFNDFDVVLSQIHFLVGWKLQVGSCFVISSEAESLVDF